MTVFMLNVLLMALWISGTGVFTYANALLGFVIGFITLYWLRGLLGDTTYFRKVPLGFWFTLLFLWEVVKSNLRVAWDVVTPQTLRQPGIVAVPLDAKTDIEITVLANLLTLTPGSLSVDVSADRRVLYVHAMFAEHPETVRQEIKTRFERWVLTLLR
jgi:multicomponent Na+:H+ antiporter subunit E